MENKDCIEDICLEEQYISFITGVWYKGDKYEMRVCILRSEWKETIKVECLSHMNWFDWPEPLQRAMDFTRRKFILPQRFK